MASSRTYAVDLLKSGNGVLNYQWIKCRPELKIVSK